MLIVIDNAENTGTISGSYAGGMIGRGTADINTSHSYQALALVGGGTATTITASYYLTATADNDAQTLTADEFKTQASFVGWDFDTIWTMGTLHPELK